MKKKQFKFGLESTLGKSHTVQLNVKGLIFFFWAQSLRWFFCLTELFSLTPTNGNPNGSNYARKNKGFLWEETLAQGPKTRRLDQAFNGLTFTMSE